MLLNSHISAYTRCLAEKVCGLVRSTWGTSQGEDKLGARDKILNTKVARRACAGQTFPLRLASNLWLQFSGLQQLHVRVMRRQPFRLYSAVNKGSGSVLQQASASDTLLLFCLLCLGFLAVEA